MLPTSPVHDEQLRQASDPTTPTEALRALARGLVFSGGHRFRRNPEPVKALVLALVRNPSTPFDVLTQLTSYTPLALRHLPENPSFLLFLLVHPEYLQHAAPRNLLALASSPQAPPPLLAAAFERALAPRGGADPLLVRTLLSHPAMPAEELARAAAHRLAWVRALAAQNPSLPPASLSRLVRLGSSPDLQSPRPPAPDLTEAELVDAPALGDWASRLAAAHPHAPAPLLERLAHHDNPDVVAAVAANPSAPTSLLRSLARGARGPVGPALASNTATPPDLLDQLAWAPPCAAALLTNPSTPPAALRTLTGSTDAATRAQAMQHPNLPPDWRALLLRSGHDPQLASPPARRPDDDDLVALLDGGVWFHDYALSQMPLPTAVQLAMARSRSAPLRRWLASSPHLDPEAARLLTGDRDPATLCALLSRTPCDERLVEAMLERDLPRGVLVTIASDPRTPPRLLEALVGRLPSMALLRAVPSPPLSLLYAIQRAGDVHAVVDYVQSTRATLEHLEQLACHDDWQLRRAVASNRAAPRSLLDRLAADPEEAVRNSAAWTLRRLKVTPA